MSLLSALLDLHPWGHVLLSTFIFLFSFGVIYLTAGTQRKTARKNIERL